jgi:hypothetical protein
LDDIVAYIRWGMTNGIVEGQNNKLRVITRRAYGFHSATALIGMIMLCCNNIWLVPPRVNARQIREIADHFDRLLSGRPGLRL